MACNRRPSHPASYDELGRHREVFVDRDHRLERAADADQEPDDERERLEIAERASREKKEDPGEQERPDPSALR